jgi:hypothetical protein
MAPLRDGHTHCEDGLLPREQFVYDGAREVYTCPAGQTLFPRRYDPRRQATEYVTRKGVCAACALRTQCTRSTHGRTLMRHREHALVERGQTQGRSLAAFRDRRRRRHFMEGSFAQVANLHHFKKARWRRLWRQQIQDWLIAACQNIKLFLRHAQPGRPATGIQSGPVVSPVSATACAVAQRRFISLRALGRFFLQPVLD